MADRERWLTGITPSDIGSAGGAVISILAAAGMEEEEAVKVAEMIDIEYERVLRQRLRSEPERGGRVVELRLCESERLVLRPDELYRFTVAEDCDR